MKAFTKATLFAALACSLTFSTVVFRAQAAEITTTKTGYIKATDVDYKYVSGYTVNWGARGEDCTFLSAQAEDFYVQKSSYSYQVISQENGGSTQNNAYQSSLYSSLKSMMISEHSYQTSYNATRDLYKYTDCVSNNYSKISSFYSGKQLSGTWDSGSTWNREHTWPNSKGLGGNDENDIMMLRPTWVSENSSRGNTAYGESSGYYDPGESTRGDCARIVLYVYTRWGNTDNMWGTGGVMESMNVLLRWMEEDPVDTWEMGRNDAVESITGTRNVFVDYPEYAWLLFGKSIPNDVVTPSGIAKEGIPDSDSSSNDSSATPDSSSSEENSSSANSSSGGNSSSSDSENGCLHEYGGWFTVSLATGTEDGLRERFCNVCGQREQEIIHNYGGWFILTSATETEEGLQEQCCDVCGDRNIESIPAKNSLVGGTTNGCASSAFVATSSITLAITCAYVYRKRKQ